MRRLLNRGDERGATLVEFSVMFGLLMMIALGAFEFGMLFRDYQAVTVATREGARVGASAADYGAADCVILEATAGALQSLKSGAITEVHIYRSDASGSYPGPNSTFTRRYSPANAGDPGLIPCSSPWIANHQGAGWAPANRANTGANVPFMGVRVDFDHTWLTDFLWWNGSMSFSDASAFRMEPPAP